LPDEARKFKEMQARELERVLDSNTDLTDFSQFAPLATLNNVG
jgi:hypothetical protein